MTTKQHTETCPYCNKDFQAAGIEVHITRKHAYQLYIEQREREAKAKGK